MKSLIVHIANKQLNNAKNSLKDVIDAKKDSEIVNTWIKNFDKSNENVGFFTKIGYWFMSIFSA